MAEANVPPERDTKDFKFQQLCKVRVTDSPSVLPLSRTSLLVSSSKYGLTFAGAQKGFKVLRTADFTAQDQAHSGDRLKHIITDFPMLAEVNIGYDVTHISLSADELTLAVAITRPEHAVVYQYDVRNFAGQVTGRVAAFHMIVGEGNKPLNDLAWNPVDPNLLVVCYSTGRLDVYSEKDMKASLSTANAKCVCWSPRGKQLVVGRGDGSLMQYDAALIEKRKWVGPAIIETAVEALDLLWLTTYSFLVAYVSHGADCSEQPTLVLITGSKEGAVAYTNFEDSCFGTGEERKRKYHFNLIQKWDMILTTSSNSSEIGIIGKHLENKQAWERWNLDDTARAECPLTDEYADTYPMGFTVDLSSQHPVPLGDDRTHPASPIMLILSTEGLIIPYHMMYLHSAAPAAVAPVQRLDTSCLKKTISGAPSVPTPPQPGAVKNLFGSTGTAQPVSKPAAAGFAFAATNLAGSTNKSGAQTPFSPAPTDKSDQLGAIPKVGAGFGLLGSTPQTFSFASSSGVQASSSKSDEPEAKPPFSAGFGTTSFAGSTNKSGTNAGFSVAPSFGAQASGDSSFNLSAGANGTSVFPTKTTAVSDALGTKARSGTATTAPAGLTFAAKITDPGSQAPGSSFKPATTSQIPTPLFGQTSQSQSSSPLFGQNNQSQSTTPLFGQTAQRTTAGATVMASSPAFGKAGAGSTAGAGSSMTPNGSSLTPTGSSMTPTGSSIIYGVAPAGSVLTPAVSKPVPSFTGQSSAFTGMPSAVGKPLPKSDSQSSDVGQATGTFAPKSPTRAPPPPTYTGARSGAVSPKFAPPPPKYPSVPQDNGDQQEAGETVDQVDKQFSNSIFDEMQHFQMELSEFKYKALQTECVVGTKDDMKQLKQETQKMDNFCTELKCTVQEQNKDVQDQRALCLDMFSMVEECRMRQQMNTDKKYNHLLKSRALDPGSAEKLQQLQLQYQVLDQGLRDVDLILDTQWEEYRNRKNNKTNRIETPTNDVVYRVVKSNHNLILAQKSNLHEMEERLKQLKSYNKSSAWNNTASSFSANDTTTELSNLADSLLSGSPVKTASDSSATEDRTYSKNRLDRLREHLCRRHVPVVRSTKPGNLSVLKIPDSQLETSSSRNSQQQLPNPQGAQRRSGDFVGMFRRSTATANTDKRREDRTSTAAPDTRVVPAQNLKNTRERSRDKTDGDAGKIIGKEDEKVGKNFPAKLPAKPTGVLPSQGVGVKAPGQQAPPKVMIPKSIPTSTLLAQKSPANVSLLKTALTQGVFGQQFPHMANVKEINGITLEDITPSGSENDVEDTEEDDEYDEESSESNGQGFGPQFSLPAGYGITSTPVTVKVTTKSSIHESPRMLSSTTTGTPVGRKLFGTEKSKPTSSMMFGASDIGSSSTKSASASKPFTFNPTANIATTFGSQSEANKSQPGFDFSLSTSVPNFGSKSKTQSTGNKDDKMVSKNTAEAKPAAGQITGLFGKPAKPAIAESGTSNSNEAPVSSTTKPAVLFGQSTVTAPALSQPSTLSSDFGQPATATTFQGIFGKPSDTGSSVIGQPSDAVVPPTGVSDVGETTPKADADADTTGNGHFGQPSSTSAPAAGLFGQVTASDTPGSDLFGKPSSPSTVPGDLFGKPSSPSTVPGDLFGKLSSPSTVPGDLFGKPSSPSTVPGDLFGQTSSAETSASTSDGNMFGRSSSITTTVAGQFGQPGSTVNPATSTGTGLFGKPVGTTTSASLFGQAVTTSTETSPFGQTATSSSGTSLFGQASSTTSTAAGDGLFGQAPTTSAATGLFGQAPTTSAATGLFGQAPTSSATTGLFGQAPTTSASTGLFGQAPTSSATTGLFGQAPTTSASTGLFGQTPSTTGASTGLFGQTTTTASSPFGQTSTADVSSTSNGGLFDQSTPSTSSSMFGQPGTLFGQASTSESGGLFGSKPATTSAGLFGQSTTSSAGGLFGQSTSTAGSGGLFGSSTPTGSGFGTATSGSGFGFGQTAPAGFGVPAFGQPSELNSCSPFGQSGTDSGGGGMFGGLGGKPSAEKANTNVFGTAQPFGSNPSSSPGLFGSDTSQSFGGGTSTGGIFSSSGAFTGGTGVAATGFGAAKQQAAGGFGSSSTFGNAPAFGGTPGFGTSSAFGSPPAFGSGATQGGFGTTPTFGSPGAPIFGTMAQGSSEGTGFDGMSPTFGGLAQGTDAPNFGGLSQSPNAGGFGESNNTQNTFGSSPSFSGYRG